MNFKVKDKVILSTKHLYLKQLNRKLTNKYTSLFKIIRIAFSSIVYKLALLEYWKIYNIFYISLLKLYQQSNNTSLNFQILEVILE